MMIPNFSRSESISDDDESSNQRRPKSKANRIDDLENSCEYVDGYTGPIHRWDRPGYQFLNESAQITSSTAERLFKIIVVGDATVGKTSFVQRYVNDIFRKDYKGTVGVDFAMKVIWKSEKEVIKLQLWDIAGQERFTWMTRVYYKDAQGCIVMFDLNRRSTFLSAMKWKNDVDSKCQLLDGSSLPTILLGNKCDLSARDVNQDEIEHAYKRGNYIGWTEVSAKEGLMIDDCVKFLVDAMLHRDGDKGSVLEEIKNKDKVDLLQISKKKSCCK